MTRIGVLGIGNVLMGDDAVGPYVVKLVEARYELPPDVAIAEVGTPGPDLPLHLEHLGAAVVVDAVKMRGSPGEIRVLDKERLLSSHAGFTATPHDPGLREALLTLDFHGTGPREVRLVGVIPGAVEARPGLSPAVQAAVPGAVAAVVRELAALGVRARERSAPLDPGIWWEHQVSRGPG